MISAWVSLVTIAALIMFFVVTINVGRARAKYGIKPPEMAGNPDFERVVRVQQNTLLPFHRKSIDGMSGEKLTQSQK
jgi:glutathione S-transferase